MGGRAGGILDIGCLVGSEGLKLVVAEGKFCQRIMAEDNVHAGHARRLGHLAFEVDRRHAAAA
jgi:hypothetical protein